MARLISSGVVVVIAAYSLIAFLRVDQSDDPLAVDAGFSLARLLTVSADDGFARVTYPWEFTFPADHVAHADYRTEWWNITGALEDERGSRLGLQVLFVRLGIVAQPPERQSRWAASEVYAGLASLSRPFDAGLVTGQRSSRAALGLAGTSLEPIRIWVEDWRLEALDSGGGPISLRARVTMDDLSLELELDNSLPLVDTNELPEQIADQSVPFQFYLQPRLQATGTVRAGSSAVEVVGNVSVEHAWGELPLPGGPIARDRFTVYLEDQRVLVLVRVHRADGAGTPDTTGLLIGADGDPIVLSVDELRLTATDYWTSPGTGARYPIRWRLEIPDYDLELELLPEMEDQEGYEWMSFWAGPVRALGGERESLGSGFVQLYGYDGR
jgi:predicted secreted hydrolase